MPDPDLVSPLRHRLLLRLKRVALFLLCLAVVAASRLILTCIGYRRVAALIPRGQMHAIPRSLEHRLVWSIRQASRLVPRATCLTQALALQVLLGRRGYASEIRIGVRRDEDGKFAAHAWLVGADRVLIGGDGDGLSGFVPLATLSPGQR